MTQEGKNFLLLNVILGVIIVSGLNYKQDFENNLAITLKNVNIWNNDQINYSLDYLNQGDFLMLHKNIKHSNDDLIY